MRQHLVLAVVLANAAVSLASVASAQGVPAGGNFQPPIYGKSQSGPDRSQVAQRQQAANTAATGANRREGNEDRGQR